MPLGGHGLFLHRRLDAGQLVDALAAARRMGFAPVVGLLTTDQVADLNEEDGDGGSQIPVQAVPASFANVA